MLFSAFFGCGLVLAEVGAVILAARRLALWVLPALSGWDLLLVAGGRGPSGCGFWLFLVAGHWWLWWMVLVPVLVGSYVGGAPCHGWLGLFVCCGGLGGILSLPGVVPVVAAPLLCLPDRWLCSLAGGPCCVRSPVVRGSPLPWRGASASLSGVVFLLAWW